MPEQPRHLGYPPNPHAPPAYSPPPSYDYPPQGYGENSKRQRTDSIPGRHSLEVRPSEPQYVARPGSGYDQQGQPYMYPQTSQPPPPSQYPPYNSGYAPAPSPSYTHGPPPSHYSTEYSAQYAARGSRPPPPLPPPSQSAPPAPAHARQPPLAYDAARSQNYPPKTPSGPPPLSNHYRYSPQPQPPQQLRGPPPPIQSQQAPPPSHRSSPLNAPHNLPPSSSLHRGQLLQQPIHSSQLSNTSGPSMAGSLPSMSSPPGLLDRSHQTTESVRLPPLQLPPMSSGSQLPSTAAPQHSLMPPILSQSSGSRYGPPTSFAEAAQQSSSA
ncbi:hypothetical protein EX30DRAFT_129871 [Ascodesmis nigricans]|uniref:Uncharacterized protein n=1 Tax=Ascodesmis nigricans TaxID=341454 RepID=A0A4S2MSG2_9PEZI|nr:hypothetical protein EX30DRAFT_129871 [Ascodesmis nigricans]